MQGERDPHRCRGDGRRARLLRMGERLLLVLGAVCLATYAAAWVHARSFQAREQRTFERALAGMLQAEEHDQTEWSRERRDGFRASRDLEVEALGRLDIPDAEVSVMVLEGTDDWTLNRAVGLIEGTARPGEPGNVGIAGHRDGFFRGLQHVELGDPITLSTLDGVGRYRVVKISVVDPDSVEVLAATAEPSLTLVTCHPFRYVGDAPRRFVVHARRMTFQAWEENGPVPGAAPRIAAAFAL